MMAKIRIPPTLRAEVGGEREIEAAGATMREVLDDLAGRYPGLGAQLLADGDIAPFVNVYLNNEDVRTLQGLDTPVTDGATVILLPAMAGGQVPLERRAVTASSLLDLVGQTPLIELSRLSPNPAVRIYALIVCAVVLALAVGSLREAFPQTPRHRSRRMGRSRRADPPQPDHPGVPHERRGAPPPLGAAAGLCPKAESRRGALAAPQRG